MNWERLLHRYALASGPLSALFPQTEFVDDGVFVTRDGHLGLVAKLDPMACECLDDAAMDVVCAHCRHLLPGIDIEMRVYQYVFKYEGPVIELSADHPEAVAQRRDFIEERRRLMSSIEVYLAVVFERKEKNTKTKSGESVEAGLDKELWIDARRLRDCVSGFLAGISAYVGARLLGKDEVFSFLRYAASLAVDARKKPLARTFDVDWQMSGANVEVEPVLRIGSQYVRVWKLKEMSKITEANHLYDLLKIPGRITIVTEWRPENRQKTRTHAQGLKTKLTWTKGYGVANMSTKPVPNSERIIDEGKQEEENELGSAERALRNKVLFGHFSLTIMIHGEDPMSLGPAAARVEECILLTDGELVEQVGRGALFAWLSTIPGNVSYSLWHLRISDEQYADMGFWFGPPRGEARNAYLEAECLTVLETRLGTPYCWNFHRSHGGRPESGHTLRTGAPRSGKTFAVLHDIEQYQKYSPYTFIFDITSGYRILTERFGGSYLELGRSGSRTTINLFRLAQTEDNLDFIFSLLRMLMESDHGGFLSAVDCVVLRDQIEHVYGLRSNRRHLGEMALPSSLSQRLARWRRGGQFGYLFDNVEDTVALADWVTFEFPAALRDVPEAMDALMYYATARCDREVMRRCPQPGLIVLDEAWSFLQRKDSKRLMVRAAKGWPKLNAVMLLATHSLYDLDDPEIRAVMESCVTRIHGSNPDIDGPAWREAFHLSDAEVSLIRGLEAQREFLVQGDGVVRLYVDELSKLRFSNSSQSAQQRQEYVLEHGSERLVGKGVNL